MKLTPLHALANGRPFRQDTEDELDTIAWGFLGSEFTGPTYANWRIERRVDAYLAHRGMTGLVNDGDAHQAVVQRVLANLGAALRNKTLPITTCSRSRHDAPDRDTQTSGTEQQIQRSRDADRLRGTVCITSVAPYGPVRGVQHA